MKTISRERNLICFLICGILPNVLSITTVHHDKPPETKVSVMASKMKLHELQLNATLAPGERQKRLLPYVNFYSQHNFNYPNMQPHVSPQRYQLVAPKSTNFQSFHHKYNEPTGTNFQPKLVDSRRVIQPNVRLTPFTDSNALPGPFIPIRTTPQSVNYDAVQQIINLPNYGAMYEKLSQLKLPQQNGQTGPQVYNQNPRYDTPQFIVNYIRKPQINYIPIREFQQHQDAPGIKPQQQTTKTIIQIYTPTNVDVSPSARPQYEQSSQRNPVKSYNEQQTKTQNAIHIETPTQNTNDERSQHTQEIPIRPIIIFRMKSNEQKLKDERRKIFEEQLKIYEDQQRISANQQNLYNEKLQIDHPKQYATIQKVIPQIDQHYHLVPIEKYHDIVTSNYKTDHLRNKIVTEQNLEPIRIQESLGNPKLEENSATEVYGYVTEIPHNEYQGIISKYEPIPDSVSEQKLTQTLESENAIITTPKSDIHLNKETIEYPINNYHVSNPTTPENDNSLGEILKNLQETNALPQSLTPENIDNSIKTLVKILNVLKKQQRLSKKPIIVAEQQKDEYESDIDNETEVGLGGYDEETITEFFPADTPEGGTPGKPGIDYPALSTIPRTSFTCKTQRYKGFFGDPETHCQVWHYCDFNGGQASFLCPNGTIFSQVALTCDWWYNVKCATTPQLYVLNERLYKYILPFSPKFPEDYTGPLVDRYLALKFQEMEEKMKKHRKKLKSENKDKSKNKTEDVDDADELQLQNEENRKKSNEADSSEKE